MSKTQKPNIDIETILKKFNIDIPISEELADDNTLKIHIKSAFEKHATIINNNQIDDLDIVKILGYPDTTKFTGKINYEFIKSLYTLVDDKEFLHKPYINWFFRIFGDTLFSK